MFLLFASSLKLESQLTMSFSLSALLFSSEDGYSEGVGTAISGQCGTGAMDGGMSG